MVVMTNKWIALCMDHLKTYYSTETSTKRFLGYLF